LVAGTQSKDHVLKANIFSPIVKTLYLTYEAKVESDKSIAIGAANSMF
jgi:hypothetical protein